MRRSAEKLADVIEGVRRRSDGETIAILEQDLGERWPHERRCWVYEGVVYRYRSQVVTSGDWWPEVRRFAPALVAVRENGDPIGFDRLGTVEELTAALPEPRVIPPFQLEGGRPLEPARRVLADAGCRLVHVDGRLVVLAPTDHHNPGITKAAALVLEAGEAIGHLELEESWGDRIVLAPGLVVWPEIANVESLAAGSVES